MRILIAVLLALVWPGALLAQDATRDRGILQAFIEDNLSDAGRVVQIDGFAGALSSRATVERLTIADDQGVWLVLEGAALDWNRSAVLAGRLEINELSAERLVLTRLPATGDAGNATPVGVAASCVANPPGWVVGPCAQSRARRARARVGLRRQSGRSGAQPR